MNTAADRNHKLEFRSCCIASAIILFVLLIGNWDLVAGRALPMWDSADYFGPEFTLVADHIKAGRLLLWNPWVAAGNPDFAEPEMGTTSPVLLLVGFLSPSPQIGFVSYWLLIWFLGGVGMLLFARPLGAPVWGGTIVALAFITSGLFTGHAEHTSSIYSSACLPWILWRFNLALDKRRYWFGVQAGVAYGLSGLGGYPEFTILTPLLLGLWTIGRLFAVRKAGDLPRFARKRLVTAAAILVLTISIGGVIFSPTYVGLLRSTRGFSDRIGPRPRGESISSNVLAAGALTTFASPYLALLNFPPNPIWPRSDVSMTSIYVSPALIVFALFAWRRPAGWRLWLAGVTLLFLCCCLGDQLPVRGWVYDLVPPTRYFRNPALFRAYVIVLLGAAAGLGIRDFTSSAATQKDYRFFSGTSLFVVLASVVSFATVVYTTRAYFRGFAVGPIPFYDLAVAQLAITGIGVVALALSFQFKIISIRSLGHLLLTIAIFDGIATLRVSKPTMYSETTVSWWKQMNSHHIESVNLGGAGLARQLKAPAEVGVNFNDRNVPLRVPTFNSYVALANRFHEQFTTDPVLAAMALGTDRFWFSVDPVWLRPTDPNFDLFRDKMHSSQRPVLVLHSEKEMRSMPPRNVPSEASASPGNIGDQALCAPAAVTDVSYGPNALAFSYMAENPGWLLVTDRWAPDWRVTVNGLSQEIMGADFIFRAIRIAKGDNLIRFRYRPSFFIPLLVVSWATLLLIALSQLGRFSFTRR